MWRAVTNLAGLNGLTGEPQHSRGLFSKVVADWAEALGSDDPALALPLLAAAQLELSERKPAAAIAPARRAVALRSAQGQDPVSRAQAEFTLARALAPDPGDGVTTESLELARAAQTHYGESTEHEAARAEVQAWLAERGAGDTNTR